VKRVILLGLLMFLVFIAPALANTPSILYVIGSGCHHLEGYTAADCLQDLGSEDYYFVKQLLDRGYEVDMVLDESVANANSYSWYSTFKNHDMVFLGTSSQGFIDITNPRYEKFCGLLNETINTTHNVPMFATFAHVYKNGNSVGCIFTDYMTNENGKLIRYDDNDNRCDPYWVLMNPDHDITDFLSSGPTFYTTDTQVIIHSLKNAGGNQVGLIGVKCDPPGTVYDSTLEGYPILNIKRNVAIWGMDTPSYFTDDAWKVFDKTIYELVGEYGNVQVDAELTVNGTVFRPGEALEINLTSDYSLTKPIIEITDPKGTVRIIDTAIVKDHDTWTVGYTLGKGFLGGSYEIKAKTDAGIEPFEFSKNIIVFTYNTRASLNKTIYIPNENAVVMMAITDLNDDELDFSAEISMISPNGTKSLVYDNEIDLTQNILIPLASNYPGRYKVSTNISDNYGRYNFSEHTFFLKNTALFDIDPHELDLTINEPGKYTETFTITSNLNYNITNIELAYRQENISGTLSKTNIPLLLSLGTTTFNLELDIPSVEGYYEGEIVIESDVADIVVPIKINYTDEEITNGIGVNPGYITIVTLGDEIVEEEFKLENIISRNANNISVAMSSNLKDIITLESIPSSLSKSSEVIVSLEADTNNLSIGTYSGSVNFKSSIGEDTLEVDVIVIGDLSSEASVFIAQLNSMDLKPELKDKRDEIIELLNEVKSEYGSENYKESYQKLAQAKSDISDLESSNVEVITPDEDGGSVIWMFAIIIILAIIGIAAYKYKDEIKEILGQKPKEEESYNYPQYDEDKDGYRSGYY